jgi:hypothetical protein
VEGCVNHDAMVRIVATREQAHSAASECYAMARQLIDNGVRAKFTVEEDRDSLSVRQRRFLHGPVLGQISDQARVNGERFVMEIWKEFLRRLILEREPVYEMVKLPGQKRATPRRVRQSTEDLNVKQYSAYIDEVLAYAATELGVEFVFDIDEREAVRYREPKGAKGAKHETTEGVTA